MDITDALAPTSDQLDAIELVNPRTFTIDTGSSLGKREGKTVAEVRLVDFPRVWRPSKGMLDVLAACWNTDAKQWVGHRVTLYNDPDVMFGKEKVGGIRIRALSHIDKPRTVLIRAAGAGRKQAWHVEPLATESTLDVSTITDRAVLKDLWRTADQQTRAAIKARVDQLDAAPTDDPLDYSGDLLDEGGAL